MNITAPLLKGTGQIAALPGNSIASLLKAIGDFTGLFGDGPHDGLGLVTSGLAGVAAALAVAIALTIYFHRGDRAKRDVVKHGIAAGVALALAASDMRHAAFAYLGLHASKPAVEFEIRMPKAELSAISDTQIELHTDRNERLARVEGTVEASNDRSVLRGGVALDYRTTDRVVVVNLPGLTQCEFKLRLAAEPLGDLRALAPRRSGRFGEWRKGCELPRRLCDPLSGVLSPNFQSLTRVFLSKAPLKRRGFVVPASLRPAVSVRRPQLRVDQLANINNGIG